MLSVLPCVLADPIQYTGMPPSHHQPQVMVQSRMPGGLPPSHNSPGGYPGSMPDPSQLLRDSLIELSLAPLAYISFCAASLCYNVQNIFVAEPVISDITAINS